MRLTLNHHRLRRHRRRRHRCHVGLPTW